MEATISLTTFSTQKGFKGAIACYENGKLLWSSNGFCDRLNRKEAFYDAMQMAEDVNKTWPHVNFTFTSRKGF